MSVAIKKIVQAVTLTYTNNFGFANFALQQPPGAAEGPDTQVGPASCPLMSVAIKKLVQAVTLNYTYNFGFANFAL